jgi:hypothetical protein
MEKRFRDSNRSLRFVGLFHDARSAEVMGRCGDRGAGRKGTPQSDCRRKGPAH